MKLLLAHGADPKIATVLNVTALQVAAGIGWVEGVTYEWSEKANLKRSSCCSIWVSIRMSKRNRPHGAARRRRTRAARRSSRCSSITAPSWTPRLGQHRTTRGGKLSVHTWQPVDYADGLVRVGVQSAIAHPEAGLLIRKLLTEKGLPAPPMGRNARVDLRRRDL